MQISGSCKALALSLLISMPVFSQEVFIVEEKIEKRFVMDPQPVTYSSEELLKFLTALQYKWRIIPTPHGSTIGICPNALGGEACNIVPMNLRDEFIALFLQS